MKGLPLAKAIAVISCTMSLTACYETIPGLTPDDGSEPVTEPVTEPVDGTPTDPGAGDGSDDDSNDGTQPPAQDPVQPPTVDAGVDLQIENNQRVTLTATASVDQGNIISYRWVQVSGPTIELENPLTASAQFDASTILTAAELVFEVTVTDSNDLTSSDRVTVSVSIVEDPIDKAVRTGNPVYLPEDRGLLEQRIIDYADTAIGNETQFLQTIYGNQAISYDPGHYSSLMYGKELGNTYTLVGGNKGNSLALASERNGQRSAAFAYNILSAMNGSGESHSFYQPMKNLLAWLLRSDAQSLSTVKKVRFTLLGSTNYNNSRNWLKSQFPDWDIQFCNTPNELQACVTDEVDLVITGTNSNGHSDAEVDAAFTAMQANQIPQMYVHEHGWNTTALTNRVMNYFGFSMPEPGNAGNWWIKDSASWASYADMQQSSSKLPETKALVQRLKDNGFDDSINDCTHTYGGFTIECPDELTEQFYKPVNVFKSIVRKFDAARENIFMSENYQLEKLMVLLGDHYRQNIQLPMDANSNANDFLRSYFADHLVYNYRDYNPAQPDMGNFSRSDFSHVTTVTKTLDYTSKPDFRSAGVYALPGQAVKVTRLDSNDLTTKIFVNSLRFEAVWEFSNNGYNRPKYLQSTRIEVKPGETISFVSPYGGPLQIAFNKNEMPVSLKFENVGEHPYWNGPEDNAAFDAAVAKGDYDWAEVVTPGFEVHSTLEKMRQTIQSPNWDTGSKLADATKQYVHNYPHMLAGFQGPGIDAEPEVTEFAARKGLEIKPIDIVKHMNADQPGCGYGCSGNPYDAGWAFSPTGHGDIHELGHGLEDKRFKLQGQSVHVHTNFYSYYTKSKFQEETGNAAECQARNFDSLLNLLQASESEADSSAYVAANSNLISDVGNGITWWIQLVSVAQNQAGLNNGWHIVPRLHMLSREFGVARSSDENWQAKSAGLGFGLYTNTEAGSIPAEDWLVIALSYAAELDYTDYFDMWGIEVSEKAINQIASEGYAKAQRIFYRPENNSGGSSSLYCDGLDMPAYPINSN